MAERRMPGGALACQKHVHCKHWALVKKEVNGMPGHPGCSKIYGKSRLSKLPDHECVCSRNLNTNFLIESP